MTYFRFLNEDDEEYGSFEVFYSDAIVDECGNLMEGGYFWWACFPGCLPDGDPSGPFSTEDEAFEDARNP